MKIILAPMEGVIDHHMRAALTGVGGYDQCVTEFIRVVDRQLPERVFKRICPELKHGGKTAAATPVTIQLLGGVPEVMALNAQRAAQLGATTIDINFGCPSRFVNRKAGGAILLKEPERVFAITRAVRLALPESVQLSAKVRLGYETTELALDNARAVEAAGANFITVHARTKVDGYAHPARWEWLSHIRESLSINVIANGDINSLDDYLRCREISGCTDVMLGRGAVARPDLARQIRAVDKNSAPMEWNDVQPLVIQMIAAMKQQPDLKHGYIIGRIKQWLVFLKRHYAEAAQLFHQARELKNLTELEVLLSPIAAKAA